jgi:hypothetical protein
MDRIKWIKTDMADVWRMLQGGGEQVRKITDYVSNIADHVAKSDELTIIKEKATVEFAEVKKTTSDVLGSVDIHDSLIGANVIQTSFWGSFSVSVRRTRPI